MLRHALLCALAALLALAPAADAVEVSMADATATVTAAPGEANRLTLTLGVGGLTVVDAGAPLSAGAGCTPVAGGAVSCTAGAFADAVVELGDGGDTLSVIGALPVRVDDGAGNDVVTSGAEQARPHRLGAGPARPQRAQGARRAPHPPRRPQQPALGRRSSVRSGLATPRPCGGSAQLRPIWKAAARSFGLRWSILASITGGRVGARLQHGPVVGGRDRLDAVHGGTSTWC